MTGTSGSVGIPAGKMNNALKYGNLTNILREHPGSTVRKLSQTTLSILEF